MREFLKKMLSTSGEVSFGRCSAAAWCIFLMGLEVWHVHHLHALPDNATMLTHVGMVSTLYGLGKVPATLGDPGAR